MQKLQCKSISMNSILNGKRTYHKFAQSVSQNGRWAKVEHEKFVECLKKFGKNWKLIEQELGSRTGSQIRSHAQKYFQKLEKFNKDHSKRFDHEGQQNNFNISEKEKIEHENNDTKTNSNISNDFTKRKYIKIKQEDQPTEQTYKCTETLLKVQKNEPLTEEIQNNNSKDSFFFQRFSSLVKKSNIAKLTDFVNMSPNPEQILLEEPHKKVQKKSFRIHCDEQNFSITNKQLESLRKLSGDDFLLKKF